MPINRTSHPQGSGIKRTRIERHTQREREATELPLAVHRTSQEQTLARLFFLVLLIISPEAIHTPHTGVGYYTTMVA